MKELLKVVAESYIRNKSSIIGKCHDFCILPKDTGFNTTQLKVLLTTGAYAEDNIQLLLDNGYVYTTPTTADRESCKLSGNVKKVFKYMGSFDDTTPTVDVYGNEF